MSSSAVIVWAFVVPPSSPPFLESKIPVGLFTPSPFKKASSSAFASALVNSSVMYFSRLKAAS